MSVRKCRASFLLVINYRTVLIESPGTLFFQSLYMRDRVGPGPWPGFFPVPRVQVQAFFDLTGVLLGLGFSWTPGPGSSPCQEIKLQTGTGPGFSKISISTVHMGILFEGGRLNGGGILLGILR